MITDIIHTAVAEAALPDASSNSLYAQSYPKTVPVYNRFQP